MPSPAPVSLCIIARDEAPRLQRLLPPIKDHFAEIIVVDTGSVDDTVEVAKKYAHVVVKYTECNNPDTGFIEDFSNARNYSMSLATQPWLMWVDADDNLVGSEHIQALIDDYKSKYGDKPGFYLFPYEYGHDGDGKCTLRHYRERLMTPPSGFKFVNEVHEVCVPKDPFNCIQIRSELVKTVHNRSDKPVMEPTRNLRILKRMYEKYGDSDARHLYYLGLEYVNTGDQENGIKFLEKYVSLSGWDDEKCMALMKLCEVYCARGDYEKMVDTAHRAIRIKESWGEPYFFLAKAHYFLANQGKDPPKNWLLCAQYAEFGLSLPITDTILFVNPLDRQVEVHRYYNVALNGLGRVKEAMDSVDTALKVVPVDPQLVNNKGYYIRFLNRIKVNEALQELKKEQGCQEDTYNQIMVLLDGKLIEQPIPSIFKAYSKSDSKDIKKEDFPVAIQSPHTQAWAIPNTFEYDDLPIEMSDEQLIAAALMIWKQYMVKDEIVSAISFLETVPYRIKHSQQIEHALAITRGTVDAGNNLSVPINDGSVVADGVYEKLVDPINELMLPAKNAIQPGGKLSITTINANTVDNFSNGKGWLESKSRKNLVAPTTWSIANQLKKAGYYVANSFIKEDKLIAEGRLEAPSGNQKLDVVFWVGDGLEPWTPETVKKTGIGGSELMAMELCKRLAALGHRVRMFVGCGKEGEGIYDGVEYLQANKFPGVKCDVLVVSRYANILSPDYNIQCKLKLLWCHDIIPINGRNKFLLDAHRLLALSEGHRQHMLDTYDIHPEHIITTRNGIDLTRFNKSMPRNRFKAINSSSPDRSWMQLFDTWPEIKKQVPQAELHLYYGFENWEKLAKHRGAGDMANLIMYKNKVEEMKKYDVVFHGRVNQDTLAEEMLGSGVWLYNTHFVETSCITAMEMQAAGVRMITTNIGALKETAGNRAVLIDGDPNSHEYKAKFISAAVHALTNEDDADRLVLQQYAQDHFSLDGLAKDWDTMIYGLLDHVQKFPLIPYQPTLGYN
jgi:glycosyltransferase involved in cell wall biosynthesis